MLLKVEIFCFILLSVWIKRYFVFCFCLESLFVKFFKVLRLVVLEIVIVVMVILLVFINVFIGFSESLLIEISIVCGILFFEIILIYCVYYVLIV